MKLEKMKQQLAIVTKKLKQAPSTQGGGAGLERQYADLTDKINMIEGKPRLRKKYRA